LSLTAFCANTFAAPGDISTIAGGGVGDGGLAASASLYHSFGAAVDVSGNIYIADAGNNRIRKVDASTGVITTVAGNGTGGYSGDGGPAAAASLNLPSGAAIDASGNIYIADQNNHRIRKVDASTGNITTIAGNGTAAYSGDGGPAASASINRPTGVTVDASGNIYIADQNNNCIRKVDASTGDITTIAGNGTKGYSGDGGPAASASLDHPTGAAIDGSGNIYIADYSNHSIRKMDASTGNITTVAGNGTAGYSGDGGPAASASLSNPYGVAVDGSGNIYIAASIDHRIRKVDAAGVITTVAGNGTQGYSGDGGAAASASLNQPTGAAVDASGNIYIADQNNNRIRKVDASTGNITTFAGNGSQTYSGDGGPASSATLYYPARMAVDASGNIYIADKSNHRIRMVNASTGDISTIAGNGTAEYSGDGGPAASASLNNPTGAAIDGSGNIYIADAGNNRIRMVDASTGNITTFAGNGAEGFSGDDGQAASASLGSPKGVAIDASGNIYIASGNRIRKVDSSGIITTVAGNGTAGFLGDGGPADSASLNNPTGVAVDPAGNIFIADQNNNRIRMVDPSTGNITTVAGNGWATYSGDGGAADSASLYHPAGVAVDPAGNIYIADMSNNRIRKVGAETWTITTIAGNGTADFSGDGGPAVSASLDNPYGVAVDGSANVYIADYNNHRIRKVVEGGNADARAPITVASPVGGTYYSPQNVTLTCGDGDGSGCANIYYTTDGTTPTTDSSVYSSAIAISSTTILRFFAKDKAGNRESVNTETYVWTCTLTTTAINGSITPGDNTEVEQGSAMTVTGSADADYYFARVSGCGGTGQSNFDQSVTTFSYETGVITEDCTVIAVFNPVKTNSAPTISGTPATTVDEDAPYSFTPTASDADAGDVLTFSIVNKPSWASFDPATGALTGTPANSDVGTTTGIVISVSDDAGAEAALPSFDLEVVSIPANQDSDGDGFTDVEELAAGSDPADSSDTPLDHRPGQPILSNLEADQTLPFSKFNFTLSPMDDPDTTGQTPAAVEWSIEEFISGQEFLELYNHESAPQELPSSILLPVALFSSDDGATFSVRYKDAAGLWSDWSEAAEIKLAAEDGDFNGNGIEDDAECPDATDVNGNEINDADEGIIVILDAEQYGEIGLKSDAGEVEKVVASQSEELLGPENGTDMPRGVLSFRLGGGGLDGGDQAKVTIYLPEKPKAWLRIGPERETENWTDKVAIDGSTVQLTLVDGGQGDDDGVVNGIIVHSSGPSSALAGNSGGGGGGGGGGCFLKSLF